MGTLEERGTRWYTTLPNEEHALMTISVWRWEGENGLFHLMLTISNGVIRYNTEDNILNLSCRASRPIWATMANCHNCHATTPATTSSNSRPPHSFRSPNFGSASPPYSQTSAPRRGGIRPRQAVRFCRLSHTIENEAAPRADRFPRTEACQDNADDVPSHMTIDKALHRNISDVLAP